MPNDFGALLRRTRIAAQVSLGELARRLGVSTPYLSDVERGIRAPLTNDRVRQVAQVLELSKGETDGLLRVASESRGFFELDATVSLAGREAGAALMRGWPQLSDEQFLEIKRILRLGEEE